MVALLVKPNHKPMNNKQAEKEALDNLVGKPMPVLIGGKIYHVSEPTLAVLDQMSLIWLTFPEVNEKWTIQEAVEFGRTIAHDHIKSMAKVIAIAVLGEKIFMPIIGAWRLRRMTKQILHSCRPTDIKNMVEIITATNGLVNFIVSMRLMSTATQTRKKTPIE